MGLTAGDRFRLHAQAERAMVGSGRLRQCRAGWAGPLRQRCRGTGLLVHWSLGKHGLVALLLEKDHRHAPG